MSLPDSPSFLGESGFLTKEEDCTLKAGWIGVSAKAPPVIPEGSFFSPDLYF